MFKCSKADLENGMSILSLHYIYLAFAFNPENHHNIENIIFYKTIMLYSIPKKVLIILGTLFTLALNLLANLLPINGITTAELSDKYPVQFVPAGYVFSIWGIIYIGLIVFAIFQYVEKSEKYQEIFNKIFPFHIAGLVLNGIWIIFWHYEQVGISVVIMLGLLISLILVYLNIEKFKSKVDIKSLVLKIPFGIYLGWISVATIANITIFLYKSGVSEFIFNAQTLSGILIIIAGILGSIFVFKKDLAYPAVIIWAIIGIAIKFPNQNVINAAVIFAIFIIFISWVYTNSLRKSTKN